MKVHLLTVILIFLASVSVYAAELNVTGTYTGKDLYIRNPYNADQDQFCIQQVFVDGKVLIEQPRASAVKIDLSHLSLGQRFTMRIIHQDDCTPVVINPHVLKGIQTGFVFLNYFATNNSIEWSTRGEKTLGRFIIQRQLTDVDRSNYWEDLNIVPAKKDFTLSRYAVEPDHWRDLDNIYRIKYEPLEQDPVISEEFTYTWTEAPISFYPKSITTKMTLSEKTYFEIQDMQGRLIKTGTDDEIWLQNLKPGEYLLKIQNRFEKFVKK